MIRKSLVVEASDVSLPDWTGIDKRITYGGDSQYGTALMKPRDYMFQFELRYAWFTLKKKEQSLDCMFLNIGNIEDIAEIIDR